MGIYIKNAKLPIGCFGCWVPKELCGLTINGTLNHRHVDCPLVEVKAPHGRLVDADNLSDAMSDFDWGQDSYPDEHAVDIVCAADTVLDKE